MKKKLKWRLGKLPTPSEITELLQKDLITKDEAREILFSEENEETVSNESLKSEIKFLRELVQKLSERSSIVKEIHTIEKPYYKQHWYDPYKIYCQAANSDSTFAIGYNGTTSVNNGNTLAHGNTSGVVNVQKLLDTNALDFTDIKTF